MNIFKRIFGRKTKPAIKLCKPPAQKYDPCKEPRCRPIDTSPKNTRAHSVNSDDAFPTIEWLVLANAYTPSQDEEKTTSEPSAITSGGGGDFGGGGASSSWSDDSSGYDSSSSDSSSSSSD